MVVVIGFVLLLLQSLLTGAFQEKQEMEVPLFEHRRAGDMLVPVRLIAAKGPDLATIHTRKQLN